MKRSSAGLSMFLLTVTAVVVSLAAAVPALAVEFKYDGSFRVRYQSQNDIFSGYQVPPPFNKLIPPLVMLLLSENRPPVVTGIPGSVLTSQYTAVSSLFTASDPDGDAIAQYLFYVPGALGSIYLNGATNLSATPGCYLVSAADMPRLLYVAGASAGVENISIWASDGTLWGSGTTAVTIVVNGSGGWSGTWISVDGFNGGIYVYISQSGTSLSGVLTVASADCPADGVPISGYIYGNYVYLSGVYSCLGESIRTVIQGTVTGNAISGGYSVSILYAAQWNEYDYGTFTVSR